MQRRVSKHKQRVKVHNDLYLRFSTNSLARLCITSRHVWRSDSVARRNVQRFIAQRPMACRKLIESIVMYRRDTLRPHCIYAAAKMQLGPDARQRQRRRLYKLCIWAEILLSENEHARNSVPRNYCNSICGSRARLGQARPFRVQNDGARNACTYIVLLSVLILVAHMHGMRAWHKIGLLFKWIISVCFLSLAPLWVCVNVFGRCSI